MNKKYTVHLDTDIGDDIDDAFCLSLLLRSPEIELKSVSTVLNDTAGRADMCRELCDAAGQSPKIVAGARSVITRRQNQWGMTRRPPHEFSEIHIKEFVHTIARELSQIHVLQHEDAAEQQLVVHIAQFGSGRRLDRHAAAVGTDHRGLPLDRPARHFNTDAG